MTPPAQGLGGRPPARRARRKPPADRRQDLLAAALACLAELGPLGASGREVCRRAGVSHGLLRHYFETPETLFLAAYQDLCDRFLAEAKRRLAGDEPDPLAALDGLFEVLFSEAWAHPDVLGAWIAFWTLTRSDAAFAEVNARHNAELRALISGAVARLQPAGSGADPDDAAMILNAVMDGLWLEISLRPGAAARAEAIALCRLTLHRLAADPR